MFDNIGGKIKTLAVVVCVVGMIASLIFAIVLWSMDSYRTPTIALGFGVLIGGCVVSWVGSFFTYGFGQLIEDTAAIREALKPTSKPEIEMRPMMNAPEHEARTKPVLQYAPIVGKKQRISDGLVKSVNVSIQAVMIYAHVADQKKNGLCQAAGYARAAA